MKRPKINYDAKHDVFSISIVDGYEEKHQEIAPGIFVELDKRGKLMGIEILNASGNIGIGSTSPSAKPIWRKGCCGLKPMSQFGRSGKNREPPSRWALTPRR